MKYIVCEEPGQFLMKEKEAPTFGENEVLLQIKTIGICGTDLHAYAGNQAFFKYPRILGHELGSQVLEIGKNVENVKPGDKVVVMPYISCGKCIACRKGKTNCCTNIEVLGVHTDGGMQERITVPADILLEVNDLSFPEIAIIEPLAIGAHAIRRAAIDEGEYMVVIGCGPIGLGIMKLAQIRGGKNNCSRCSGRPPEICQRKHWRRFYCKCPGKSCGSYRRDHPWRYGYRCI